MKITRFPVAGISCLVLSIALFTTTSFSQELSDAEIASVAVTANQIDIDYAKIAQERSKNADVLKFAETMINDHNAIIGMAVELVTKLKVTPKDNDVSKKLLADAEKTKKMLKKKSGSAFDKAYVDNEVAYHKAVIAAVETVLIPQADNAELKALLEKVMPALRTHLGHAEMLQKKLK